MQQNMMWNSSRNYLVIGILAVSIFACNKEYQLKKVIREELSRGIKHDSLFLGLKFGITIQEFYDHCWELNRQGLVREGPRNMSVEYIFKDSLDQPVAFNFYADRNGEGPIRQYNTSFYYYAWALNRHLYSDRLMEMLPAILMDWYGGNEPISVIKEGKEYLYKVDGNRMIEMFIYDQSTVAVTYYDLSHEDNREVWQ